MGVGLRGVDYSKIPSNTQYVESSTRYAKV
jgi:hypothetical protein